MKIKSLWHTTDSESIIKETSYQNDKKVLIKSLFSMISPGTERLVSKGNIPKDLYDSMTVPYMEGDFYFPIKYGYSLVGEVFQKDHPLSGKRVHLLHPHQDFCFVKEEDLFIIPDEVDSKTATLASNLETALNAIWDAKISIGDKVLVVGFGLIGSLVARLVDQIPGTELILLDTNPEKIKLAKNLGFKTLTPSDALSDSISSKFDVAFNCSTSSVGLQTCIDLTGFESKVVELSWYGNQTTNIQLGGTFHQQRKQLISSQVSNLPSDRRGRWNFNRRKETVFNLLKNPIFKHHITQNIKFAVVPAFFDLIRQNKTYELGILIDYKE